LQTAQTDETPADAVPRASAEIDAAVTEAARAIGSASTSEAVAAALETRRPEDWTSDQLATVQAQADRAARAIRQVQNLTERA